jgi:BirA family biotin operon repressor/biotin-[acetyl-CoA-carboxylase] ligase
MEVLASTSSTNDVGRQAAERGAADGHVVVADSQSAGRGQYGRQWSSLPGSDLYFSIVDRPRVCANVLPVLTLAVGLGVSDAVDELLGGSRASQVKWPNDVWVDSRKCAGILIETSSLGDFAGAVVIGIGLNVNRREWPNKLRSKATSIAAGRPDGESCDRAIALARLLFHVERWVDLFVLEGPPPVVEALDRRLALRGEEVLCGTLRGVLRGVADSGALRLETPSHGVREVVTGPLERFSPA